MHCQNLDAYFHMAAQGNKDAYGVLIFLISKKSNSLILMMDIYMDHLTILEVMVKEWIG